MEKIKLILLYGPLSSQHNGKYQMMIDGKLTCGYRPFAEKYGCIIYLSPQKTKKDWELSICNPKKVIQFINKHPDAIVWAIKHNTNRD